MKSTFWENILSDQAAPYAETAVVAPQLPSTQAPLPAPNQPQPAILTAAHFQGPYAPYPDGYSRFLLDFSRLSFVLIAMHVAHVLHAKTCHMHKRCHSARNIHTYADNVGMIHQAKLKHVTLLWLQLVATSHEKKPLFHRDVNYFYTQASSFLYSSGHSCMCSLITCFCSGPKTRIAWLYCAFELEVQITNMQHRKPIGKLAPIGAHYTCCSGMIKLLLMPICVDQHPNC